MKRLLFAGSLAAIILTAACASAPPAQASLGTAEEMVTAPSGITLRLLGIDRTEAALTWAHRGRLGSVQIQWQVNGTQAGIDNVPASLGRAVRRFPDATTISAILTFEGELPIQTPALVRRSP